jgi:hypothetical protein
MERRSTPDAPPANYLPLSTAFDRFCERYQGKTLAGHVETEDEWRARLINNEKLYRDFVDHLRMGRLRAIVCHPLTRERMPIPCDAWTNASYPERPLKAHVINGEEGEGFLAYKGRTPFVSEDQLSTILCPTELRNAAASARRRGVIKREKEKVPGIFAGLDEQLVKKMRSLLRSNKVLSVNAAANKVAQEAHDRAAKRKSVPIHLRASVDSIAHRLAKRYRSATGAYYNSD